MNQEVALNKISDLIGLIYDAAENPSLWPVLLDRLDHQLAIESCNSSSSESPATSYGSDIKSILANHFHRALSMSSRLKQLKLEKHAVGEILNRLPIGVILVDHAAHPYAINQRAQAILNLNSGLMINNGHIETSSSSLTEALHHLIRVNIGMHPAEGKDNNIQIRQGKPGHICIWVAPSSMIPDEETYSAYADDSLAVLFITSSSIPNVIDIDSIAAQFQLTAAEAKLVGNMANSCHSLNEAAEQIKISKHTARTQMKHILLKAGVNSQMELMKKVLTDPSRFTGLLAQSKSTRAELVDKEHAIPQDSKTIKLYNGKHISYCEYGDPHGKPVFVCHGIACSRYAFPPDETESSKKGIRFIVPDRPGHGYSDLTTGQDITDWPYDLVQLAEKLEIKRFSLLGYASGGAYAMSCAHLFPARIDKMALISTQGPLQSFAGILPMDRAFLSLAKQAPDLFYRYVEIVAKDIINNPIKILIKRHHHLSPFDQQTIEQEPFRQMFEQAVREASRQGVAGICEDISCLMKPWGFEPKEITVQTRLWHGMLDHAVPLAAAKELSDELPHCETSFIKDSGQFVIFDRWPEIVSYLADE